MNISLDLNWIQPVMLASVRFTVFVVLAPPFNTKAFPGSVKAMLAVGLAIAVSPRLTGGTAMSDGDFVVALVMQALIGLVFGVLVKLIFSAVDSAGALVDQFGGFSMATAYDPTLQLQGAAFTRLFGMMSSMLLFTSGAYRIVLSGLARTFDAFPLNAHFRFDGVLDTAVHGVGNTLLAAIEIAGPLVIVLFLADVALGLITRVAPQTNVFSLGFPVKILVTLSFVGLVIGVLPTVFDSLTSQAEGLLGVSG